MITVYMWMETNSLEGRKVLGICPFRVVIFSLRRPHSYHTAVSIRATAAENVLRNQNVELQAALGFTWPPRHYLRTNERLQIIAIAGNEPEHSRNLITPNPILCACHFISALA